MAQVVRGPEGPKLRDRDGKYTAISFQVGRREVWISNTVFRSVCAVIILTVSMTTGTIREGFAVPDRFINWMIRGAVN